jgi:hypothetical protein
LDVLFRNLLGVLQFGENGEFGTYKAAEPAIHAFRGPESHLGRMIALFVKAAALPQTPVRTKFYAKAASFAAAFYDPNLSLGHGVFFGVKG